MNDLETMQLEYFIKKNNEYEMGKYFGSEFCPYNIDAIAHFIKDIRPTYSYVDDWSEGNWTKLDIVQYHSKYGTNYIYLDNERKLWRTYQTASEFYSR